MNSTSAERPVFLTVLCVLSFINGGMNIVFNIPSLFMENFFQEYVDFMKELPEINAPQVPAFIAGMLGDALEIMERLAQNFIPLVVSTMLLALMSVTGAWQMWNLKKQGFLFYVIAQILWTCLPLIFIGTNIFTVFAVTVGAVFTGAFILLYSLNLKYMR